MLCKRKEQQCIILKIKHVKIKDVKVEKCNNDITKLNVRKARNAKNNGSIIRMKERNARRDKEIAEEIYLLHPVVLSFLLVVRSLNSQRSRLLLNSLLQSFLLVLLPFFSFRYFLQMRFDHQLLVSNKGDCDIFGLKNAVCG